MGWSTHDEYVRANACSMGAAYLDPLQHSRARLVPSLLTLYCQCGLNIIGFNALSIRTGFPNICRSSN